MKTHLRPLAGAVALALSLHAAAAQAQRAPGTGPGQDPGERARELDNVVVTATRSSKAIDKIPGAVAVVTRQELDDQLMVSEDLNQVLASQVPGYAPSRQKLTSFGESLRGRVPLILFDGIPQSNPLRAGARESHFADPSVIERIEVISGASAVQGLGATGGIINYISRRPRTEGTTHTIDLKYGTQFEDDDALLKVGYRLEHKSAFDALLYVGATQRGVGVDGNGRRLGLEATQGDTQDSTSADVFAKVGADIGANQRVQVSINQFRLEGDGDWQRVNGNAAAGITTSARRGLPIGEPPRNRVRTVSGEWSHADLLGGIATVQLYTQDFSALYGAGTFAAFQDPVIAPVGTLVDQSEIVADKEGLRTTWVRPDVVVPGLELTTGLDWLRDNSEQRLAQTGRTWVPRLEFESIAPFAQLEYTWGDFTLRGGARHEDATLDVASYRTLAGNTAPAYTRTEVQGGERSFSQWVENLGGVWRFAPGWSVFAGYSEGFGVPDVGLVLRAVRTPGQSVEQLIALEPVLTDNTEVGITWAGRMGSFTASVYESYSELGSVVRINPASGQGFVERLPVEVRGFEFAGELRPAEGWTVTGTYARTDGFTAQSEGRPLDVALGARFQGPDKAVLGVRWEATPALAARLQGSHYFSRHINEGRGTLAEDFDGYTVFDAAATWRSPWGDFGLGIENLLDRQYIGYYSQAHAFIGDSDYFAGRGRTYTLSWTRTFR
jgi:iron complex outermembrane receptor protein